MYTQIQELSFLDFKPGRVFGSLKYLHATQFIRNAKCISETSLKYLGSVLFFVPFKFMQYNGSHKNLFACKICLNIITIIINENNFYIICKLSYSLIFFFTLYADGIRMLLSFQVFLIFYHKNLEYQYIKRNFFDINLYICIKFSDKSLGPCSTQKITT